MEPARKRSWHQWDKIRRRVIARDCGLCQECERKGFVTAGCEVDHIKPVSAGGDDSEGNLQLLCAECHKEKTRTDLGRKQRTRFVGGRVVW